MKDFKTAKDWQKYIKKIYQKTRKTSTGRAKGAKGLGLDLEKLKKRRMNYERKEPRYYLNGEIKETLPSSVSDNLEGIASSNDYYTPSESDVEAPEEESSD